MDFAADQLNYENNTDIVTASGDVRMASEGNRVRADRIVWNRKTGKVHALGNVVVVNPGGDTAYGDDVELTDTLKDGVVNNLLLVLANGGRLAARHGTRTNGITTLDHAAYSPCPVVSEDGCPKKPSWQITAVRIIHDPEGKKLTFKGARVEMFGLPILVLPTLTQPLGDDGAGGFLVPNLSYNRTNGFEVGLPYYLKMGTNRDLTITPHAYTAALPALEADYRALTSNGAYKISAFATYGTFIPIDQANLPSERAVRWSLDATGKFQLDPEWSISGTVRRVSDRTFLLRYDRSYEDRLRSNINIEHIDDSSYFSVSGWAVQTLRALDPQGQIPVAAPIIDYRKRIADPVLGGIFDLQLNTLALTRTAGQDTQRAFAGLRWDLRKMTSLGQEVIFTAYGRADIYHSAQNAETTIVQYQGLPGFQSRAIGALAAEIRWPFIGEFMGGTQRITPRIQLVASPPASNLNIPNEDSRSVDLEDSNLFALNRFPGYDRWEGSSRVTYGLDYAFDRPGLTVLANVGQSYRFSSSAMIFPDGTGLTNQTSDIVGRFTVKYKNFVEITQRFRFDKDNFALRRNEVDATIGSQATYFSVGYLKLNRNIDPTLEDLRDREEIRLGGRVQIGRYFSIFGSTTIDLTSTAEDPTTTADGYEPVRHRIGIAYTDNCLDIGLSWRRDYDTTGDATSGNSFLLRLVFRGLGR
ncbi:LPS-assembly protein LptD [Sphingomonas paeninsulae]|uniref:LPS-assembly protein LptD n=1 Tax=Sphingomonas paeninsulae TaxID=2319844 RepID=A0A494TDD3_SPHPE|nr:LPS assembly protein LptD [Sphingomonas paeninsulae]AYJ87519.1 LPS-assembly protein LptD [Sphingomonas paeninsulae]